MSASLPEVVRAALDEMPPDQQRAFALMVLHGVPMRKVAADEGCEPDDLQALVVSAMKHVKKRLDEAGLDAARLTRKE